MQSAMEKSVGKNETYYTASTGHPFALGTAPDHINSHRQPWNTWKHWFQRVPESKWNRAKTTINHQKLSEKCLLTSLYTLVQSVKPLSVLLPSHLRLTHNLTQNRKKAEETMEQRGLECISRQAEKLLKAPKTSKPYFGAQLITQKSQVQVLSPQPHPPLRTARL